MERCSSGRRGERGAAAVELAIVLPLLLVILFGIVEFGLLLYNRQVLTNASREGARAGIVASSPRVTAAAIQGVVSSYCASYLVTFAASRPAPTTTVTTNSASGTPSDAVFGDDLTVRVQYPYRFLVFPGLSGLLSATGTPAMGQSLTISATAVMKYE